MDSQRGSTTLVLLVLVSITAALAACGAGTSTPARGAGRDFAARTGSGEAARGLRSGDPIGAAIKRLGVTYGPYLGMRCRHAGYDRCHLVGIDVVFGHAATRVVAAIGSRTIHLRTPGQHNRVPYRDWVGTFTHADFVHPDGRLHRHQDLVYVAVELRVRFADGRRARALFPHVLVSSGWG